MWSCNGQFPSGPLRVRRGSNRRRVIAKVGPRPEKAQKSQAPSVGTSAILNCARLPTTTTMDHLPPPVRHRPRSTSPLPSLPKILPRRRPLPLVILTVVGMSVFLWSFSLWPLLSSKPASKGGHAASRCPICPANSQPYRPSTTPAEEETGVYTRNLTLFGKPMHTFRGT